MSRHSQNVDLKKILKGVSRSFYLSLVFLPRKVRIPISLAFLACKAADTIADTELLPKEKRLQLLDAYRELFSQQANGFAKDISKEVASVSGGSEAERELLSALPALMDSLARLKPNDWLLIRELVLELTQGMQIDLNTFKGDALVALQTEQELEQYTYYVAGCVGRFWTKMMREHFSFAKNFGEETEQLGEKLGKGLQLVNILRDLPRDLEKSRCYLPEDYLKKYGLRPASLFEKEILSEVKPILFHFANKARVYLEAHKEYVAKFPWYALRLKAVVKLPALLGLQTLDLLKNSKEWLNPNCAHKISRKKVYRTLLQSFIQ